MTDALDILTDARRRVRDAFAYAPDPARAIAYRTLVHAIRHIALQA